MCAEQKSGSTWIRLLRTILYALAIAFLIGFAIGTWLRREVERPTRYIGAIRWSVPTRYPGDIRDTEPGVLVSSHDEEQV